MFSDCPKCGADNLTDRPICPGCYRKTMATGSGEEKAMAWRDSIAAQIPTEIPATLAEIDFGLSVLHALSAATTDPELGSRIAILVNRYRAAAEKITGPDFCEPCFSSDCICVAA